VTAGKVHDYSILHYGTLAAQKYGEKPVSSAVGKFEPHAAASHAASEKATGVTPAKSKPLASDQFGKAAMEANAKAAKAAAAAEKARADAKAAAEVAASKAAAEKAQAPASGRLADEIAQLHASMKEAKNAAAQAKPFVPSSFGAKYHGFMGSKAAHEAAAKLEAKKAAKSGDGKAKHYHATSSDPGQKAKLISSEERRMQRAGAKEQAGWEANIAKGQPQVGLSERTGRTKARGASNDGK
jgi:colicin import membrane protein